MTRSPASRAFNRHALGAAVAALWSTHGLAQQAFPSGNPPPQFCRVGSFTELNVTGRYNVSEQLQLHAGATNLLNRHAPPDLQTFGAAGGGGQLGGAAYNPAYHQDGAVGPMFTLGATYTF